MENPICRKVISMLSQYIDNKLEPVDILFVETHFLKCPSCYQKYLEMKEIMQNLHFEYNKLINEFDKIESGKIFNIREYESFYKNISPYIDDELCYDESIKFRKYILKSKQARNELSNAYMLKNNIRSSVAEYKDNLNINYSKKVLKKIKNETIESFDKIYKRAAIVLGFMLSCLIILSLYMGYNYINEAFAKNPETSQINTIEFPKEEDWVEFTFDNNEALLTLK